VQCLYYHSKKGAENLAMYKEQDGKTVYFRGNACPKAVGELQVL